MPREIQNDGRGRTMVRPRPGTLHAARGASLAPSTLRSGEQVVLPVRSVRAAGLECGTFGAGAGAIDACEPATGKCPYWLPVLKRHATPVVVP
jgi:hypothetical protein